MKKGLSTVLCLVLYAVVLFTSLFLMSQHANADTIGVHTASIHSEKANDYGYVWNNANPGIYLKLDGRDHWTDGIVIGTYYNSIRKQSFYVGYSYALHPNVDIIVGAISGYGVPGYEIGRLLPMVVPSVHFGLGAGWSARINYAVKVNKHGAHALNLSIERKF